MDTLPARASDPQTSQDAAQKAAQDRPSIRTNVLTILRSHGPLTLDGLVQEYVRQKNVHGWKPATEQGIRSRCAELVDGGLVEQVPDAEGRSRFGNRARLWRVVSD